MRRVIWFVIAVLAATAGVARATPPQVVSVDDVLFGVTDTHVFLLRSLEDNTGRYGVAQTDILLIARNRITNSDDDIWPVARSITYAADIAGDGAGMQVDALPIAETVNPFDIAAAQGVRLMLNQSVRAIRPAAGVATYDDGALVLSGSSAGENFRLGFAEISQHIAGSLERTRDVLPAHFTEGGVDVLRGVAFDPEVDCAVEGFVEMRDSVAGVSWLVRMTCENEATMAPVSTYLTVPPEE